VNAGVALLVGIGHGGALAAVYDKATPEASGIRMLSSISLPFAALIFLTAAAALMRPSFRPAALAGHGFVLAASAIGALAWAVSLLIGGLPQGNFAWSPGLMTALVCYSAFLASRYSVSSDQRARFFYAPAMALAIAAPIDIGVFVYFIAEMTKRFS